MVPNRAKHHICLLGEKQTISIPGKPFYDSAHWSPQALSSWIRSPYSQRVYYQLGVVSYLDLLTHTYSQRRYYDSAVQIVPVIKDFINKNSSKNTIFNG